MRRWRGRVGIILLTAFLLLSTGTGFAAGPISVGSGAVALAAPSSETDLLKALFDSLKSENETLKALNAALQAEKAKLSAENTALRSELDLAKKRISELESLKVAAGGGQSVEALANQLKSRVYKVEILNAEGKVFGSGSAVAISRTEVITNYHVIEQAASVRLVTDAGASLSVLGVTAFHQVQDLAVLRVQGSLEPVVMRTTPVKAGEEVVAIGSPIGLTNTVSTGIVSSVRVKDGVDVIQVTAPISHGSSGGGLFDRQGNLIGVTTFGYEGQNLNFAVSVQYIPPLLAKQGPVQDLPGKALAGKTQQQPQQQQPQQQQPQQQPPVPTGSDILSLLRIALPTFELNGFRITPEYELLPMPKPKANEAPEVLAIFLDKEQFGRFAAAVGKGDFAANKKRVETYLAEAGALLKLAYPGKDVMVFVIHDGEYAQRPPGFADSDVEYNAKRNSWFVFSPIIIMGEVNGSWNSLWR